MPPFGDEGRHAGVDRKTLAQLIKVLKREPDVVLAYLFGSRARGAAGGGSDWDVAVLTTRGRQHVQRRQAELAHLLGGVLGTGAAVDVVILNRASPELCYAVISEGQSIVATDEAVRVDFEAATLARYGDYLPFLRAQRRQVVERDEHGARVQRYRAALGRTLRAFGEAAALVREDEG